MSVLPGQLKGDRPTLMTAGMNTWLVSLVVFTLHILKMGVMIPLSYCEGKKKL